MARRPNACQPVKLPAFRLMAGLLSLAVLLWLGATDRLPWWVIGWMGCASMISACAVVLDKRAAATNKLRTRERTMLLFDLAGGWPGGMIAQGLARHKTKKTPYQLRFWLIVAGHLIALGLWLWR